MIAKAEADAAELVAPPRQDGRGQDRRRRTRRASPRSARSAADAAARAAAAIIAERHGAGADKALVDRTIAGLGRPN